VVTGDLVKSSTFKEQRNKILNHLRKSLKKATAFNKQKNQFIIFSDIFRGDSFQGVLSNPSEALSIALYIRAQLRIYRIKGKQVEARIGIGLGTLDFLDKKRIEESDGQAFQLSGKAIDSLRRAKEKYRKLWLLSPRQDFNHKFFSVISLLDAVIQSWSVKQAEAMALWLEGKTQQVISKELKIRQPAVFDRLQIAGHFAVKDALDYYKAEMKNISLKIDNI